MEGEVARGTSAPAGCRKVLGGLAALAVGIASCSDPSTPANAPAPVLRGVYITTSESESESDGEDAAPGADSLDGIDFTDDRHFVYWAPGCGFAPACEQRGTYKLEVPSSGRTPPRGGGAGTAGAAALDTAEGWLTLEPERGATRSVPFAIVGEAGAGAARPADGRLTLVEGGPVPLLDPCSRSPAVVRLGRRIYESLGTSETRAAFQATVERQLRELGPGEGEQGPVLHIGPANPRANVPTWTTGGRRLFFRGSRLVYRWRRPGGLETEYELALADAPNEVVAEATATTRCGDLPLFPQDARCTSEQRTARFRWRYRIAMGDFDGVAACARSRAASAGIARDKPLAGLQVLLLPMRYDRFGPTAPDTNTFVAYAVQLQRFYQERGADAVYELVDGRPEDLLERLARYQRLDRRYDRIVFLGHGGGDGLLWDRRWEQIGLNWPHGHPDLRTELPPGEDGWRWPYSYWPALVDGREVAAPDPPAEIIRRNRPAFDELMALTRSLLRPGAWVYLGTCNGGLPSAIDVGRRRPFVELHACETGARTFGLAAPQAAEHSALNVQGLENALIYPPGLVVGSPDTCSPAATRPR